jgi:hypothetical protein
MSNGPVPLEQAIDEAMVHVLSPEGGREYLEAVQQLKKREDQARAKAQAIVCGTQSLAETALAVRDWQADVEEARKRFRTELRRVMEREAQRSPRRESA